MKQQPNKVICAIFWAFFEHIVFYEDQVSTCGWLIRHWLAKCSKGISRPFLCQPRLGNRSCSEQRQSVGGSWDDLYLKISIQSPVLIDFMIYFSRKATFDMAPSISLRHAIWVSTPWREGLVSSVQCESFLSIISIDSGNLTVCYWKWPLK